MTKLSRCILTGHTLVNRIDLNKINSYITYEFIVVGKVKITQPALLMLTDKETPNNPILAGICRNAFENNNEPPLITEDFISNELKTIKHPKSFIEKYIHFLKFIYSNKQKKNFFNAADYSISFAEDSEEFTNILNYLNENSFLKWDSVLTMAGYRKRYYNVQITAKGIDKIKNRQSKLS